MLDVGHLCVVDSVAMINLDSLNQTRLITTDYGWQNDNEAQVMTVLVSSEGV